MAAEPVMNLDDMARAICFMAELAPEATVPLMTVMANGMPYIGRD